MCSVNTRMMILLSFGFGLALEILLLLFFFFISIRELIPSLAASISISSISSIIFFFILSEYLEERREIRERERESEQLI